MEATWRASLGGTVACLSAVDTLQLRVTAKEFGEEQKYGPHADFFHFCYTTCEAKWTRSSQQDT